MRYCIERQENGDAKITLINDDGTVKQEHVESDPEKANAMTNALESVGKLGVTTDLGAP